MDGRKDVIWGSFAQMHREVWLEKGLYLVASQGAEEPWSSWEMELGSQSGLHWQAVLCTPGPNELKQGTPPPPGTHHPVQKAGAHYVGLHVWFCPGLCPVFLSY